MSKDRSSEAFRTYPSRDGGSPAAERRQAVTVPRTAVGALRAAAGPLAYGPLARDRAAERLMTRLDLDGVPATELWPVALRLAIGDHICQRFLARSAGGLVVSVGSFLGTLGHRIAQGAWLDVDSPAVASMRHDMLGRRPAYRQTGVSLTEPALWMQALGERVRPVLLLLEEPLLTLPDCSLEALVDGAAAYLPSGSEMLLMADAHWPFTIAGSTLPGAPLQLTQRGRLSTWPRLRWIDPSTYEEPLRNLASEHRHMAYLLRGRDIPSLLHLHVP